MADVHVRVCPYRSPLTQFDISSLRQKDVGSLQREHKHLIWVCVHMTAHSTQFNNVWSQQQSLMTLPYLYVSVHFAIFVQVIQTLEEAQSDNQQSSVQILCKQLLLLLVLYYILHYTIQVYYTVRPDELI